MNTILLQFLLYNEINVVKMKNLNLLASIFFRYRVVTVLTPFESFLLDKLLRNYTPLNAFQGVASNIFVVY